MKQAAFPRYVVGGALILVFVAMLFADAHGAQLSTSDIDGVATYRASSDPVMLVSSLGILALYIWVLRLPASEGRSFETAGIWRRFWAFLVDFLMSMLLTTPWIGLVGLLVEAHITGYFTWHVERSPALDRDWQLGLTLIPFGIAAELAYFILPQWRMRASPGSVLLGIAVRPDPGKPLSFFAALGRTLLGFIALCGWVVAVPMALFDEEKRMWQDQAFGTRVVRWTD